MKRLSLAMAAKLRKRSPSTLASFALMYPLVLGTLDLTTPEEASFTIFYVLGVAFAAWAAGTRMAVLVSALSTSIMAVNDGGAPERGSFVSLCWNVSTRFLIFCAVGWLTAEVTRLNRHLQELVEARTTELLAETQKHRATSAQLSEALARLSTIIGEVPMVLFAVNKEGELIFEDGRALDILGVKPGARVGQKAVEAYGKSKDIQDHVRRALEGEEFCAVVDLGAVSFETWYSPVRNGKSRASGFTAVALNVTDRRRLERQILEISDREQARIGQELHDGLCQQLVSLAFDANALETDLTSLKLSQARMANRIANLLDTAITEARQLARGLFPIRLDAQGLPSALEELARTARNRFGVRCHFEKSEPAAVRNKVMATHLYRIAQEAVNNAIQHGPARAIALRLRNCGRALELEIEDDGRGISPAQLKVCQGMGLHIMDYRARSIGGTFVVASKPEGGTKVSCCVPLALS